MTKKKDQLAELGVGSIDIVEDQVEIDTVATTDLGELAASEAFMNEVVKIHVHASNDENQNPLVVVNVNGINQPIVRGITAEVKRKYVEVLARMKETRYSQGARNLQRPEASNELIARTALCYPFEIIEDKNPKGRAWLQHILAEPA